MIQSLSLAIAGSFYPVGLLFVLRYLAAPRGLLLANLFLIGGAIGCLAVAILELELLESLPVRPKTHPDSGGGLDIALGAVIIAAALIYLSRKRRPVEETGEPLVEPKTPGPGRALVTGLIIYSPGLGLIAAIRALSNADLSGFQTGVGLVLCCVIILWMAEVPILATKFSPRRSGPLLRQLGSFVAEHGRAITVGLLIVIGIYLVVSGLDTVLSH